MKAEEDAPAPAGPTKRRLPRRRTVLAFVAFAAAVGISVIDVVVAIGRPLTDIELALFRGLATASAIICGLYLPRPSEHARAAFRTMLSLYYSLARLREVIARLKVEAAPAAAAGYDTLDAIVLEQISTADLALEDWRDIVPNEVDELEARHGIRQRERARHE